MRRAAGRPLWILFATAVTAAGLLLLAVPAAPSQEEPEYVGSDLCQECHADQWDAFEASAHYALTYKGGGEDESGCESCHGPGLLHVELAGTEEPGFREAIISFTKEDAWVSSGQCMACHQENAAQTHFLGSEHARAGVACADCHNPHLPAAVEFDLRGQEPYLCYQCHADKRAQFQLTEHHPVEENVMGCTDCHSPHGSTNRLQLHETENEACGTCHIDKTGPWVFPHPPVEAENCTVCHQPHGSVNQHMLTHREVRFICLQCHTVQPSFHVQTRPDMRTCQICHAQIHGSNIDPYFLE